MSRKRTGRPARFASVPNETIDDSQNLDFMALGLLNVLLRHKDGWNIRLEQIGKKYGYGEDAMAGAMGLLQVARYVVKVRTMSAQNLWSTETVVYDTPATEDDIEQLLADIRDEEPDARRVEVIPPTKKAIERAEKRRAKITPRVGEFPDSGATRGNSTKPQVGPDSGVPRDSGGPGVSKKTVSQKTNLQKTSSVRPSVPSVTEVEREARTDGRTDGGGVGLGQESGPVAAGGVGSAATVAAPSQDAAAAGEVPAAGDRLAAPPSVVPVAVTPGVELLLAVGAERPELLLSGQTLRDQGLTVTGMLAEGWSAGQLRYVIAGRALPSPLRKTVGAVIAARLRAALATPPPSSVAPIPEQAAAEWDAPARHREPVLSTTEAAARPVAEATTRRVSYECQGEDGACGRPVSAEGVLCHRCAPKPVEAAPEALGDMSWEERLAAAIAAAEEAEREEYYATGQDLVDARGGI